MAKPGWLRRVFGPVRVRTTLAATLVVAIALAGGGASALDGFRSSLLGNVRGAATSFASYIASLASAGHLPSVLGLPDQSATFAQVIGPHGAVLAASTNIDGEPAVGPVLPRGAGTVTRIVDGRVIGQDGGYGLVAVPVTAGATRLTVYAGYSLRTAELAVRELEVVFMAGLPLVLAVVAATTWAIVGRALRPVEAIRTEVGEITARDLRRRVPQPAGSDEVSRLAGTMNSMLERLEASIERQRAFVADASHELRSPLSSLRAQLEIGLVRGAATDWRATAAGALAGGAP
jgi:signal transduction histidine kinase